MGKLISPNHVLAGILIYLAADLWAAVRNAKQADDAVGCIISLWGLVLCWLAWQMWWA